MIRLSHLLVLGAIASISTALASGTGDTGTSFTIDPDPSSLVLFVESRGGLRFDTMSFLLFGDGRVEIDREFAGRHDRDSYYLQPDEMNALLLKVVDFGLADFDEDRIEAERKRSTGQIEHVVSDGMTVTVRLHLATLSQGGQRRQDVRRSFAVNAPDVAVRRFPEIREYVGVLFLQRYMDDAVSKH